MATKTIFGITGATSFVGTEEFELQLASGGASKKMSASNIRKQLFAGGTGFTATDPLNCGALAATTGTFATRIDLGTNPASNGIIRLPNDQYIYGRNAANNGNVNMIGVNTSDDVVIQGGVFKVAGSGNVTQTAGTVTFFSTIATGAPTGGAGAWKIGIANAVSPTAPNRTVTIDIGGTLYYLAAKTTND